MKHFFVKQLYLVYLGIQFRLYLIIANFKKNIEHFWLLTTKPKEGNKCKEVLFVIHASILTAANKLYALPDLKSFITFHLAFIEENKVQEFQDKEAATGLRGQFPTVNALTDRAGRILLEMTRKNCN